VRDPVCGMEVDPQNAAAKTVRDGEYFCAMWNFDGPKSEEAKSRAMCIVDTFARRMDVLTDPAANSVRLRQDDERQGATAS
jgi:YHS domain-containing protein